MSSGSSTRATDDAWPPSTPPPSPTSMDVSHGLQPESEPIPIKVHTLSALPASTSLEYYINRYDRLEEFFVSLSTPIGIFQSQQDTITQADELVRVINSKPANRTPAAKEEQLSSFNERLTSHSQGDKVEQLVAFRSLPDEEIVVRPARIPVPAGENAPWDINSGEERRTPLRGRRIRRPLRQRRGRISVVQPPSGENEDAHQAPTQISTEANISRRHPIWLESQDFNPSNPSDPHRGEFPSLEFADSSIDNVVDDSWSTNMSPNLEGSSFRAETSDFLNDQQYSSHMATPFSNEMLYRMPILSTQPLLEAQPRPFAQRLATSIDGRICFPNDSRSSNHNCGSCSFPHIPDTTTEPTVRAPESLVASTAPSLSPHYSSSTSFSDPQEDGIEPSIARRSSVPPANASLLHTLPLLDEHMDKQLSSASMDCSWLEFIEDHFLE